MRNNKICFDLSKKSSDEVYDFLQALIFARHNLCKKGYILTVKKSRKKTKRLSK